MTFYNKPYSTIFTQNRSPLCIVQIQIRSRIIMQIEHISAGKMVTSTRRIYQTCRIIPFCPFCNLDRFELSPSFIKRYPCTNTRIRIKIIDNLFPLFSITCFRLGRTIHFRPFIITAVLPLLSTIAIRHILPDNDAQLIAISIPTCRFDFDMFSYHIKTHILRFLNIVFQSFIGRSCI